MSDRLRTAAAAVIVKLWEMDPVTPGDRRTSAEIRKLADEAVLVKLADVAVLVNSKAYWNALADMLDILNEPQQQEQRTTTEAMMRPFFNPPARTTDCACEGSFGGPQAKHSTTLCDDGNGWYWRAAKIGEAKRGVMGQIAAVAADSLTAEQRKMGLTERGAEYLKRPAWDSDYDG